MDWVIIIQPNADGGLQVQHLGITSEGVEEALTETLREYRRLRGCTLPLVIEPTALTAMT